MRYSIIILASALLWMVGCASQPAGDPDDQLMAGWSCKAKLYQSSFEGATDAIVTLGLLDRGKLSKTHDFLTGSLALRLNELRRLSKNADKDDLERQAHLAHSVLKHIAEHREQFVQDTYSLQTVIVLKSIVTNTTDIQCATDLTNYLATTSTNQILWPTP